MKQAYQLSPGALARVHGVSQLSYNSAANCPEIETQPAR